MKKALFLLPLLLLVIACNNSYVSGEDAFLKDGFIVDGSGKPITGKLEEFYPNEAVAFNCTVKNGLMHGRFFHYDTNGKIERENTFWEGKLHGTTIYYRNGVKYSEYFYKQGDIAAPVKFFRQNGSLQFELEYKDGRVESGACVLKSGVKRPLTSVELWLIEDERSIDCD